MLSEVQRLYFSNGEGWIVAAFAAVPFIIAFTRLSLLRAVSVGVASAAIVLAHHMALSVVAAIMLNPFTAALLAPTTPRMVIEVAADRLSMIATLLPIVTYGTIALWVILVAWALLTRRPA
jgi:hypothetical protein